jgi:D-glycero-alpha-D-manno-heptose-7-phosphate kinase
LPPDFRTTIRARAPLRLGLAGGGTDLSPYCDQFGGAVLNATIDRSAYAFITPRGDGQVLFRSGDLDHSETFAAAPELPEALLSLHRGVYQRMVRDFNDGAAIAATITTTVDVPRESGLGASSALVVALVSAFAAYLGIPLTAYEKARLAWEIERVDLELPGGRQDHYAAAFGGVNFIEFFAGEEVVVTPLRTSDDMKNELEASLIVCFAGGERDAAAIILEQITGVAGHRRATISAKHRLKAGSLAMKKAFLLGDIRNMADILRESWQAKQLTASGISTPRIEQLCEIAFKHGAWAGKVSGAGGGGFVMFFAPPENRLGVIRALAAAGAEAVPVKITDRGCETWRPPALTGGARPSSRRISYSISSR